MSSESGDDIAASQSGRSAHVTVNVHPDTADLIDEMKPEYMARGAFTEGVVWMFFGHLRPDGCRRLTVNEHRAIHRLKESGVNKQLIADAFAISTNYVRHVQSEHGEGGAVPLNERGGNGDD